MKQNVTLLLLLLTWSIQAEPLPSRQATLNALLCESMLQSPPNLSQLHILARAGAQLDCQCEAIRTTDYLAASKATVRYYQPSLIPSQFPQHTNRLIEAVIISPAQIALAHHDYATLRWLIGAGLDLDAPMASGFSPLEWTLQVGDQTMARFLIKNGAQPQRVDIGCPYDINLARWLIDQGADPKTIRIDCVLHDEQRAHQLIDLNDGMHKSARSYSFNELTANPDLLTFFINGGLPLDRVNNSIERRSLLSLAAEQGNLPILQLLLAHQAPVDQSDSRGWTPLRYAITAQHYAAALLLLDHQADPDARDTTYTALPSPLALAVTQAHLPLLDRLLTAGATLDSITQLQIIRAAVAQPQPLILMRLIEAQIPPAAFAERLSNAYLLERPALLRTLAELGAFAECRHPVFAAITQQKQWMLLDSLLLHPIDLNAADSTGHTALQYAYAQGEWWWMYRLLEHGAALPDTASAYHWLSEAVTQGNLVLTHQLLTHGRYALDNARGAGLLLAATRGTNLELVKLLLKNGASVSCECLFEAITAEHLTLVKLLTPHLQSNDCEISGKSPLQWARRTNKSYHVIDHLRGL